MFVSWAFKKAGCDDSVAGHSAYCPSHVNWFKARGRGLTGAARAGDVIFFKDSGGLACHVGIVEKADGARVYTIEGNTSSATGVIANGGAVARKSYPLNYGWILGYGRPNYKEEEYYGQGVRRTEGRNRGATTPRISLCDWISLTANGFFTNTTITAA
jgi:hypothetical protein